MGFFSKDSSSSSSSTVNQQASSGADGGSLAISTSGAVSVYEPAAIKQVFDFAGSVYERSVAALNQGFQANVGQLAATLEKQTIDSGERLQSTIGGLSKTVLYSLAAVVAVYFIFRRG